MIKARFDSLWSWGRGVAKILPGIIVYGPVWPEFTVYNAMALENKKKNNINNSDK